MTAEGQVFAATAGDTLGIAVVAAVIAVAIVDLDSCLHGFEDDFGNWSTVVGIAALDVEIAGIVAQASVAADTVAADTAAADIAVDTAVDAAEIDDVAVADEEVVSAAVV